MEIRVFYTLLFVALFVATGPLFAQRERPARVEPSFDGQVPGVLRHSLLRAELTSDLRATRDVPASIVSNSGLVADRSTPPATAATPDLRAERNPPAPCVLGFASLAQTQGPMAPPSRAQQILRSPIMQTAIIGSLALHASVGAGLFRNGSSVGAEEKPAETPTESPAEEAARREEAKAEAAPLPPVPSIAELTQQA